MSDLFVMWITLFISTVGISFVCGTPWPVLTFIVGTLSGIAIHMGDGPGSTD